MKFRLCVSLLALFTFATVCLSKSTQVSDDAIYDQVRIRLASDALVKGGALKVDVKEGVVTLGGAVEMQKQKERAEKIAKKVKGVKHVVNNIVIRTRGE
ncbi:MAG TPA: BON domain-containing protein [Bryobacteraceae bacterium]|nr:BON domain-containing protein [Bryobacteraceae bacterium]